MKPWKYSICNECQYELHTVPHVEAGRFPLDVTLSEA